ncbi:MAG: PIN domain-containing protein [Nitrospirota bacterium]
MWVHVLRPHGDSATQERLRPLLIGGQTALIDWVILELMTGIRSREDDATLRTFLGPLPKLPVDERCWEAAFDLAVVLRRRGVTPSAADCLIAASAIRHRVPLIHMDGDFTAIARHSRLKELSWIRG